MIVGMMIIKDVKSTMIILEEILNKTAQEIMSIGILEIERMAQDIETGTSIKEMISGMKNDLGVIIKTLLGGILRSWMNPNTQGLKKVSPMTRRLRDSRTDVLRSLKSCLMIKMF